MGNPQTLGKELHLIHKPHVPWGLFGVVALLSAISLIGMSSVDVGYSDIVKGAFLDNAFRRQAINILIGIVLMFGLYFIDFRKLKSFSWVLYGTSIAGILSSIFWGITMNGVNYGPRIFLILPDMTSYRPYVLIVALAGILVNRKESAKKENLAKWVFRHKPSVSTCMASYLSKLSSRACGVSNLFTSIICMDYSRLDKECSIIRVLCNSWTNGHLQ